LFKEGDFIIITADGVKGIIEVKANVKNQGLEKVLNKANENGKFIYLSKTEETMFFNGIFSFEGFERLKLNTSLGFEKSIQNSHSKFQDYNQAKPFLVNHISLNKDIFYKFWHQNDPDDGSYIYIVKDLSFSYFISNLISYLTYDSVANNFRLWFPIDKSRISKHF
jgi:hypothetical protein